MIRKSIRSFVAMVGLVFAGLAGAQVPSVASLTGATPAGDWSMRTWEALFGAFVRDPFAMLGGPTTLMGSIFIVFNSCIFAVGVAWALYGVMSGVIATAHEGEVLGRRMSTIWFPIRMITGIAGSVPIFGGFTLSQAIMMSLTVVGIGIGNSMWSTAVNNTSQMQGLMQMQTFSPSNSAQVREASRNMFMSNVCVIAQNEHVAALGGRAGATEQMGINSVVDANGTTSYQYGSQADPVKCGSVGLTPAPSRGSSTILAFRSGAVNYDAIAAAVTSAYRNGMGTLQSRIGTLASIWYRQRATALSSGSALPDFPLAALDQAVADFVNSASASVAQTTQNQSAIQDAARNNMLSVGWFGAGAWFSTFAEVNAGIADASKGPTINTTMAAGGDSSLADVTLRAVAAGGEAYRKAQAARTGGLDSGDPVKTLVDSAIADSGCGSNLGNSMAGTATGNCSLGQGVVSAAIKTAAIGSGGGGNGVFSNSGLVNPIIMMKNMGDYIMTFSSTMILGDSVGGKVLSWVMPGGKMAAMAGSALDKVTSMGGESDGSMFAVIKSMATIFLVLGSAMAIYIPLIPFITWMGAILAYAASMIEGLAGAPLHALAHLDGDGDGMGQRTTHGYLFYINALARPALMIIGFFMASSLLLAIGTLQTQMFLPAMANVQGNSVTGLMSILMLIVIFFVINMTLITACFNLIYVITDQVIGFVGGQIDSKLGRDTEDKANNVFLMASRVGPGAVATGRQAAKEAKDSAAKAAAAKAGGSKSGGLT